MQRLARLVLLGTGGTIASTAGDAAALTDYAVTETVDSLLSGVPGVADIARVRCERVFDVDSSKLTQGMVCQLAVRVKALLAKPSVDGVVITHGTDTIEETAYFLQLVVRSRKPVVLVGAMRPGSALSADGSLNLRNALCLAASPEARGLGVLVLLNDRFFSARFVSKMNTTRVDAFDAPDYGSLGLIAGGRIYRAQSPVLPGPDFTDLPASPDDVLPSVDVIYDHQGAGLHLYTASIRAGVAGIVVAACGNGNLSPNAQKGLRRAVARGIVCVRSSRVPSGVVTHSARDEEDGLVAGSGLNPQKARILLMLALTKTKDRAEIQSYFDRC